MAPHKHLERYRQVGSWFFLSSYAARYRRK